MALRDRAHTMMVCPNCGCTEFRLEQRVGLKQPDPINYPDVINIVDTKSVYACVGCNQVIRKA